MNTSSLENVPPPPELYKSSTLLSTAFQRAGSSTAPTDGIQLSKYNVVLPTTQSEEDWQAALDTASATLEHQYLRANNVELLNKFGSNSWRISNFLLEKNVDRLVLEVEKMKQQTEHINRQRKQAQVRFPNWFNFFSFRSRA